MAINKTRAEQRKQAAEDLADKLRLERKMHPGIKRIFRRMADDLEANVLMTGGAQNAARYLPALNGLTTEQYEDSKRVFAPQLFIQLEDEPEDGAIWTALLAIGAQSGLNSKSEILTVMKADSTLRVNNFIEEGASSDASQITRTNVKDLDAAIAAAGVVLIDQLGREPTRGELAAESRKQFLKHDLGRTSTIAATTTQNAAEGVKDINNNILGNFRNGTGVLGTGLPQADIEEHWDSILDTVTRISHAEADGQRRENGTYTVQGQLLRYPGDTSLGATIDNTINCRCASIFSYDEPS